MWPNKKEDAQDTIIIDQQNILANPEMPTLQQVMVRVESGDKIKGESWSTKSFVQILHFVLGLNFPFC